MRLQDGSIARALAASYLVEPFFDAVNFNWVPADCRVLFDNVTGIAWDCIKLSRMSGP